MTSLEFVTSSYENLNNHLLKPYRWKDDCVPYYVGMVFRFWMCSNRMRMCGQYYDNIGGILEHIVCSFSYVRYYINEQSILPKYLVIPEGVEVIPAHFLSINFDVYLTLNYRISRKEILELKRPINGRDIENIVLPKSLKFIDRYFLGGHQRIKSVEFHPECQLTEIKTRFMTETDIQKITIPKSVTKIGNNFMISCKNLIEVNIMSNKLTKINDFFLAHCISLKKLVIPNSVNIIKNYFAYNCRNLEELYLPTLTSIGSNALGYCDKLRHMKLPSEKIGEYLFYGCRVDTDKYNCTCQVCEN